MRSRATFWSYRALAGAVRLDCVSPFGVRQVSNRAILTAGHRSGEVSISVCRDLTAGDGGAACIRPGDGKPAVAAQGCVRAGCRMSRLGPARGTERKDKNKNQRSYAGYFGKHGLPPGVLSFFSCAKGQRLRRAAKASGKGW